MRCTKPRQPALNENFNLPYGSHVKKHDTRLLIGRIAFLTCGKSDTRHLIGLHRFANENLLWLQFLLQSGNKLLVSEVPKKLGVKREESYPDFKVLAHVIQHGLHGFMVKNIEGE